VHVDVNKSFVIRKEEEKVTCILFHEMQRICPLMRISEIHRTENVTYYLKLHRRDNWNI
jgi:hypothetical protein